MAWIGFCYKGEDMEKIYTRDMLASYLDHAVLDPRFSVDELKKAIQIGVDYKCKSVCVNPDAIDIAKECIKNSETKLCVVCDFPFGSSHQESKLLQARSIIEKGDIFEIDMVANYGRIKSHDYAYVTSEIKAMSELCHLHHVGLKVIIETDALSKEDIKEAVQCCIKGNADFVKTSTGYCLEENIEGASPSIIKLIKEEAKGNIKVKGSGCIRSKERLLELIHLGIDRAGVGWTSTARILGD